MTVIKILKTCVCVYLLDKAIIPLLLLVGGIYGGYILLAELHNTMVILK